MKLYFGLITLFGFSLLLFLSRPMSYKMYEEITYNNTSAIAYANELGIDPYHFLPFQLDYIYEHELSFLIESSIQPYYPASSLPTFFERNWSLDQYIDRASLPTMEVTSFLFMDKNDIYHLMVVYKKPMSKETIEYIEIDFAQYYTQHVENHQISLTHNEVIYDLNLGYRFVEGFGVRMRLPSFYIERYFHKPLIKGAFHITYASSDPDTEFFSLDLFMYQETTTSYKTTETLGINQFVSNPQNLPSYTVSRHHIFYIKERD